MIRLAGLRERDDVVSAARVEDVARLEPALARDADAKIHIIEALLGMRVRADFDRHAQILGTVQIAPVEIEPVWIGIELDRRADFTRLLEHRLHVEPVRLAVEQQPAGWVRENGQMRIIERA